VTNRSAQCAKVGEGQAGKNIMQKYNAGRKGARTPLVAPFSQVSQLKSKNKHSKHFFEYANLIELNKITKLR
jgi:hypothetical protein